MVQPLPLHYVDATLLLPVVAEHTIDERSPLYGACGAETWCIADAQLLMTQSDRWCCVLSSSKHF
jgi:hypothetical protein